MMAEPAQQHAAAPSPEHRCASCRRPCRACAGGEPCTREVWCRWCANAYAENGPAPDGRAYCLGEDCGDPFPSLAKLIERGLSAYPRFCRACREERRTAAADDRATDATVGTASVVGDRPPPPPGSAAKRGRPKAPSEEDERETRWQRGGFEPRHPAPKYDPPPVVTARGPFTGNDLDIGAEDASELSEAGLSRSTRVRRRR